MPKLSLAKLERHLYSAADRLRQEGLDALGEMVASVVDGPFGSNLKTEHYVSQSGVRVVRLNTPNWRS